MKNLINFNKNFISFQKNCNFIEKLLLLLKKLLLFIRKITIFYQIYFSFFSKIIVTGPSFSCKICMSAPNTPVFVGAVLFSSLARSK